MHRLQVVNVTVDWWKGILIVWMNALAVFFAPVAWIALLVGLATIMDMAFGIWRTKKLNGKVTSRKMRMGFIYKTLIYVTTMLFVFAVDVLIISHILGMFTQVQFLATKIFALILIGIEVYSMDESYKEATGKSFLTSFFTTVRNLHKVKDAVINKQNDEEE
jgi:hypothetical protein